MAKKYIKVSYSLFAVILAVAVALLIDHVFRVIQLRDKHDKEIIEAESNRKADSLMLLKYSNEKQAVIDSMKLQATIKYVSVIKYKYIEKEKEIKAMQPDETAKYFYTKLNGKSPDTIKYIDANLLVHDTTLIQANVLFLSVEYLTELSDTLKSALNQSQGIITELKRNVSISETMLSVMKSENNGLRGVIKDEREKNAITEKKLKRTRKIAAVTTAGTIIGLLFIL